MLASLDPHDDREGSFNGMVLESDERVHIDAGILLNKIDDQYCTTSHPIVALLTYPIVILLSHPIVALLTHLINTLLTHPMDALFFTAGILKGSTFSIHQYDGIRCPSRDSNTKREWLDVSATHAMPHNGDPKRLESNHSMMPNVLRSRSRDSDVHDLTPSQAGEASSSTHTPSTHNSSQGVAGI